MLKIGRNDEDSKTASYAYFIFSRICKLAAILNNLRRFPIPLYLQVYTKLVYNQQALCIGNTDRATELIVARHDQYRK